MPDTADARPLTVEDIAKLLGRRCGAVRALLARGDIPGVKLAGRWYVSRATFDKLLAGELR
jgi:excisionase family DNA binding protein